MKLRELPGAPFSVVFDVGGNVGEFAEACVAEWPAARVFSFEPLPGAAAANRQRAAGRWTVYELGISEHPDELTLWFCTNQHSASTLQAPGTTRARRLGIVDRHEPVRVQVLPLDRFTDLVPSPTVAPAVFTTPAALVKIDVEGHELPVLKGARRVLDLATTVICEVQQDAEIFLGSASAHRIDAELRLHGLQFAGVAGVFGANGSVLQFDGVWTRAFEPCAQVVLASCTNRNS